MGQTVLNHVAMWVKGADEKSNTHKGKKKKHIMSQLTCTVSNCLHSGIRPQGVKIILYFICTETQEKKKEGVRGGERGRGGGEYLNVTPKPTNADNEASKKKVWRKQ